jgi:TetR/AcrR family transcriptional regulator, regulator of mycofactocin system
MLKIKGQLHCRSEMSREEGSGRGRPRHTSREEVARTALALFVSNGFEETTLDDVATAVGIGRRTLFAYFASKNDLVWGEFEEVLDRLRAGLADAPPGESTMERLSRAVVASNHYEGAARDDLRMRMTLITTVPALQAHSMVRYDGWRQVVSEFIAGRINQQADDVVPLLVGHMALGASMASFLRWVMHPEEDLSELLRAGYGHLTRAFAESVDAASGSS